MEQRETAASLATRRPCIYTKAFTPSREAGTNLPTPEGWQAWLAWWLVYPWTVTHPSTHRARRCLTSLIKTSYIPQRQATTSPQTVPTWDINHVDYLGGSFLDSQCILQIIYIILLLQLMVIVDKSMTWTSSARMNLVRTHTLRCCWIVSRILNSHPSLFTQCYAACVNMFSIKP